MLSAKAMNLIEMLVLFDVRGALIRKLRGLADLSVVVITQPREMSLSAADPKRSPATLTRSSWRQDAIPAAKVGPAGENQPGAHENRDTDAQETSRLKGSQRTGAKND